MFEFIVIVFGVILLTKLSSLENRITLLENKVGRSKSEMGENIPWVNIPANEQIDNQENSIDLKKEELPIVSPIITETRNEPKENNRDLEFKLGGKVFTGIGAVAIMLGIGFFLRYTFENNLITETTRVVLGIFVGIVMLGIGESTRRKFSVYSQILTGGGLGILYLSLYAAFGYYHIISQFTAFVGMTLITASGVFLAVRYNSLILAIFSQIGGFLTPGILSTGENNPHVLFLYITLLDLGILSVAWWKLWRLLVFIGFGGTALTYIGWFSTFYTESQLFVAEGYATLFFVLFTGVLLVHHFIRKTSQDPGDLVLATINSGLYFLTSYIIIVAEHHNVMGIFTVALATIHFILALIIKNDGETSLRFRQFLIGIGIVLLTIAIPIQFEKHWVTISWAVEALVLTYLGFQMKSRMTRFFADGIYSLSFLRLIFIDATLSVNAIPWLNDRVLSFVFCIILFALAVVLYERKKEELDEGENRIISFLAILTSVAFLVGGSAEIMDFFSRHWLSAFWSIGFAIIFAFAFIIKSLPVRIFASVISLVALVRLLFIDIDVSDEAHAYFNIRVFLFFISAFSAMAVFFLYKVFQEKITQKESIASKNIISIYSYILTIFLFSAEISDFHPQYWLPIAWSLIALLAGWISFKVDVLALRLVAYFTFVVTFFRLLGFENSVDLEAYTPLFNSRTASFMIAVVSMGTLLWLLKKSNTLNREKQIASVSLFLATNFLLIWLVSVEFIDYFRQQYVRLPEYLKSQQYDRYNNLENVSLSISWTIYSIVLLVLGIFKKSTMFRLLAVFIFSIVIFKVFLFDTSNLSTLYKFISFLTLGVILLLTGFLYNRYKERILEFIKV